MTDPAAAYAYAETAGAPGGELVFTFHGTGGSEVQFHDAAGALVPGAHVISPRGDVSEMGALRYFRRTGEGVYDMADLAARTRAMAAFLAAHKARLSPSRVTGLGYSNGANILASVAMDEPALVDRLVLLHPLIPFDPPAQPGLAGRSILITAGQRDPICPADMTRRFADWLTAQGAEVDLFWHAGGHEIAPAELDAIRQFLG
jgi:phospholipase/carboxylesterase